MSPTFGSAATVLTSVLQNATGESRPQLTGTVLPALLGAISRTAATLRGTHTVDHAGGDNVFGDAQLNVDVLAEQHFRDACAASTAILAASSEEDPVEVAVRDDDDDDNRGEEDKADDQEVYTVAFDPLDGSSIIAPNWSVGSIIGIWAGRTALNQNPRSRQIAAVLGVYGPRTTAIIAVRVPGRELYSACIEVGLSDITTTTTTATSDSVDVEIQFLCAALNINPSPDTALTTKSTRYFAPANLRAAAEDPRYMALVTRFVAERYTLRYSGGLVPDVVHALVKGQGVYVSPVTAGSRAKLRRAFELLPVALVVECAGGKAVEPLADGSGFRNVLDTPLRNLNETAGFVCGTTDEVERVVEALTG